MQDCQHRSYDAIASVRCVHLKTYVRPVLQLEVRNMQRCRPTYI